jgi:hypothetical protein
MPSDKSVATMATKMSGLLIPGGSALQVGGSDPINRGSRKRGGNKEKNMPQCKLALVTEPHDARQYGLGRLCPHPKVHVRPVRAPQVLRRAFFWGGGCRSSSTHGPPGSATSNIRYTKFEKRSPTARDETSQCVACAMSHLCRMSGCVELLGIRDSRQIYEAKRSRAFGPNAVRSTRCEE